MQYDPNKTSERRGNFIIPKKSVSKIRQSFQKIQDQKHRPVYLELPVKKYDKYLGRLQTRLFNEDDLQSKKILEKRINSVNKIKVEKK